MVTIDGQGAPQHVTHNLNQVKGRMHGTEEPLPCLFGNVNDARTCLSCEDIMIPLVLRETEDEALGYHHICCIYIYVQYLIRHT